MTFRCDLHLLLLQESRVGHIIYNALTEHRRRKCGVDLLGIQIGQFSVENELIALLTKVDGDPSTQ